MNPALLFPWIAGGACVAWAGSLCLLPRRPRPATGLLLGGCALLLAFLGLIWWEMERPPLRTLGETRLWYALLLPLATALVARAGGWRWPLYFALPLAALFLGFTWQHPESWDRTLMPALRSPWFVPHVVAYLLAYAFLSAAFLGSVRGLWQLGRGRPAEPGFIDHSIRLGFAWLTLGLVIGAVWAKQAWGHYWAWDPKETWALLTWLAYLGYLHYRLRQPERLRPAFLFVAAAWGVLLLCWFGLNLFALGGPSVHTYAR